MFAKILSFLIDLLPFISKAYPKAKPLSDALKEIDKRSPIKIGKSWRDKV